VPENLQSIGKYQITDLLGQGAMGVVYRALDPLLNRYVAIKVMSQGIAADPELRDRFLREARAAGSLQHPNIITIYDFGDSGGSLYIAMEYIEGSDLSEIMARQDPLPLTGKIDIVVDALHALDYAHSRGVVHRDVKPANIRVSTDGHAKLMDFGIARLEKSNLTKSGMMMGTPSYMAPEQITGGNITPATDVFAIGAVLYEFLANRPTFEGDTLHAVLYRVVSEQPPPLREVAATLPISLQPIVDKALAKDPKRRYPTAGAMATELEAVRAALSGGATVRVAARSTPLRTTIRADVLKVRKRRRFTRAGVIVGVAALAAAAVLWFGGFLKPAAKGPAAPSAPVAAATRGRGAAPTTAESGAAPGKPSPDSVAEAAMTAPGSTLAARPAPQPAPAPSPADAGKSPHLGGNRTALETVRHPRAPAVPAGSTSAQLPAPTGGGGGAAQGQAAAPAQQAPAAAPAVEPTSRPAAPAAPTPQPAPSEPQPQAQAPAPEAEAPVDPRPQIEELVAAYARAIESKSLDEMRRVYPNIRTDQRDGWRTLFTAARGSVKASLTLSGLDVSGTTAAVQVTGHLEYDVGGGTQRPQYGFRATASLEGGAWRFKVIP
jgi:serine/threonine-protein kinase